MCSPTHVNASALVLAQSCLGRTEGTGQPSFPCCRASSCSGTSLVLAAASRRCLLLPCMPLLPVRSATVSPPHGSHAWHSDCSATAVPDAEGHAAMKTGWQQEGHDGRAGGGYPLLRRLWVVHKGARPLADAGGARLQPLLLSEGAGVPGQPRGAQPIVFKPPDPRGMSTQRPYMVSALLPQLHPSCVSLNLLMARKGCLKGGHCCQEPCQLPTEAFYTSTSTPCRCR